ncbi:MAG: Zn-dependent alcohol dehydrogenase, partial [Capsulimonadales bacterium]|nr:Zn-dependent alcohol dehydrogenase [Capsulimonadales bacterium]
AWKPLLWLTRVPLHYCNYTPGGRTPLRGFCPPQKEDGQFLPRLTAWSGSPCPNFMKVKAAVLRRINTPFSVEELDLAPPGPEEALVEMKAAGVCHSDWHLRTGATNYPLPVVPGHEGAGIVTAVGERVTRVRVGDHVSLNWAANCGECFYCRKGLPCLCAAYDTSNWAGTMPDGTTRFSRDGEAIRQFKMLGCFASHTVVPEVCCVPMPHSLPFPLAALIGCAVTTGVGAVRNRARVEPGDRVAVFGCGGVGLSILLAARLAGANPILAVDTHPDKLAIAQRCGATEGLLIDADVTAKIRERTEGRGADFVFEAVGIPSVQERCFEAVRPGGTLILAGLSAMGSLTNFPAALLTRQEKTIAGTYYGSSDPQRDFPLYADLHLSGQLDLAPLVSRTYPPEEINEAFEAMLSGRIARAILDLTAP